VPGGDQTLRRRSGVPTGLLLSVLMGGVSVLVLVAHWPALSARALSFDDNEYLTDNYLVRRPGWASASRFLHEVLEPSTVRGYYQPLTMISLMLDYAAAGRPDNLRPFHRTSLCLHVANTALVIGFVYAVFGQAWVAAMVGLLFGVHPLTVEPIPWVGERKTLLAAFFTLVSLLSYVRYARRGGVPTYAAGTVGYVLALMSKPTSTPLPLLMLLLDYWPLNRLGRRAILEKVPLFLIGGVFAAITYVSQARTAVVLVPDERSAMRIVLILCHNIVFYLKKMVWPANLSSHYPFPQPFDVTEPAVLAGVLGTLVLLPALLISLRWTRALLTGWLFFFVAVFPTMGVIGFTNVIASDKYVYLPSVGILLVLAWALNHLWGGPWRVVAPTAGRTAMGVAALIVAAMEIAATRRYLSHWKDTDALYRHMLSLAPQSWGLHCNFGNFFVGQGRLDEAIRQYDEALRLQPGLAEVHGNMGNALAAQGKIDEALHHYRQVVRLKPDYPQGHTNLGRALADLGRLDEAIHHYNEALRLKPNLPGALNNLAWLLATQEGTPWFDPVRAVELARQACEQTNDQHPDHLDTLAAAYAAAGRFPEAVSTARRAVELALSLGQTRLASEIRTRLSLYEKGRTHCETTRPSTGNRT